MKIDKNVKWLCENAERLERFSGQWIAFTVNEGVVKNSRSLAEILKKSQGRRKSDPVVFHVPSKKELGHLLR